LRYSFWDTNTPDLVHSKRPRHHQFHPLSPIQWDPTRSSGIQDIPPAFLPGVLSEAFLAGPLREIVITDPEGQNVPPVAFETFDACPFPDEIKDEAGNRIGYSDILRASGYMIGTLGHCCIVRSPKMMGSNRVWEIIP
jgi:hypothetical protein